MKYGFEWSFSFFRSVLFMAPSIVAATAFWGFLSFCVSSFDPGGRKQAYIARLWARTLLLVSGTRVRLRGQENLKPGQHYIFVSNHRSYMDTPVVLASIPGQFRFMAKSGLFKIPLLGGHLHRAGHIPVPLENPREAVKAMGEAGRVIRERGISVLVFPEGGRTSGQMEPFREGAAFIAIKAQVPVVPLGLVGTFELLPMHSVHIRPRQVELRIGQPIETAGMELKDRGALTALLRRQVADLISYT
jgi:1-acyl-sn-glycerol-3-phosphate acyltransferase